MQGKKRLHERNKKKKENDGVGDDYGEDLTVLVNSSIFP